ncbi:hypothetical protein [Legionella fallonii]|uniref:PilZ domain-containing protein n=1 Tax=Legionella fallonii LLAP-10 TaxID=1212491 RepID=A0A098G6N3_9GAMM|nr:hypothetical protein [Legionella fallonii]CEG58137.1 conserved protein of unknown function [Legionella fallonii LLAP-10]
MDERRGFFRIKNKGIIHAKTSNGSLDIINISSSGALVIKNNRDVGQQGIIELSIHNFSMLLHYEISKVQKNTMVLTFKNEDEIDKLFLVLKNLRDEHSKQAYNRP